MLLDVFERDRIPGKSGHPDKQFLDQLIEFGRLCVHCRATGCTNIRLRNGFLTRSLSFVVLPHGMAIMKDRAHAANPTPSTASIGELRAALGAYHMTAEYLVRSALDRIEAVDRQGIGLKAISFISPTAIDEAQASDRLRRQYGIGGPLDGIPILVKDNMDVTGWPTAAGTLALASLIAEHDANIVTRLREAGAILIGKTAMHELAAGITGASSLTGYARNAYAPTRSPGGSSSGAAVAVAAGYVPVAIGSDTAGSVRIPAAFQNLYGLRASRGAISLKGIVPLSPTQDMPGPLARHAGDLARVASVLTGDYGVSIPEATDVHTLRIGTLDAWFGDADTEENEISAVVREALSRFKAAGAQILSFSGPDPRSGAEAGNVIAFEFADALAADLTDRPDAPVRTLAELIGQGLHHWQMDEKLRQRTEHADTSSLAYRKARDAQNQLRTMLESLLESQNLSVLAYPTVRKGPTGLGGVQTGENSLLSPVTGLPAVTLPAGFTEAGLPVGLELLGRAGSDRDLISIAQAWADQRPKWRPPAWLVDEPFGLTRHRAVIDNANVILKLEFTLNHGTNMLSWDGHVQLPEGDRLLAVVLHRRRGQLKGPVVLPLLLSDEQILSGSTILTEQPRAWLIEDQLDVRLYTAIYPLGHQIVCRFEACADLGGC